MYAGPSVGLSVVFYAILTGMNLELWKEVQPLESDLSSLLLWELASWTYVSTHKRLKMYYIYVFAYPCN